MKVLWKMAGIGSVIGAAILVLGMAGANGAVQEATAAALAVGAAVLPYVLARAVQLAGEEERQERRHQEILQAIRGQHAAAERPAAISAPSGLGSSSPLPMRPPA